MESISPRLTLANLKRAAASYKTTVEDDSSGEWINYNVIAPEGKEWACDGIHQIKLERRRGGESVKIDINKKWKGEEIRDALSRISYGLVNCNKDCEYSDENE